MILNTIYLNTIKIYLIVFVAFESKVLLLLLTRTKRQIYDRKYKLHYNRSDFYLIITNHLSWGLGSQDACLIHALMDHRDSDHLETNPTSADPSVREFVR